MLRVVEALGVLESLQLDAHGTLRVALPFCGSMHLGCTRHAICDPPFQLCVSMPRQELPILAHFLATRCSGSESEDI